MITAIKESSENKHYYSMTASSKGRMGDTSKYPDWEEVKWFEGEVYYEWPEENYAEFANEEYPFTLADGTRLVYTKIYYNDGSFNSYKKKDGITFEAFAEFETETVPAEEDLQRVAEEIIQYIEADGLRIKFTGVEELIHEYVDYSRDDYRGEELRDYEFEEDTWLSYVPGTVTYTYKEINK